MFIYLFIYLFYLPLTQIIIIMIIIGISDSIFSRALKNLNPNPS